MQPISQADCPTGSVNLPRGIIRGKKKGDHLPTITKAPRGGRDRRIGDYTLTSRERRKKERREGGNGGGAKLDSSRGERGHEKKGAEGFQGSDPGKRNVRVVMSLLFPSGPRGV